MNAGPQQRRISVPVNVGGVTVGGGAPDRRAVDDQHRHRRRGRHRRGRSRRSRAPAPRSCASRSIATRPPPPCRRSRSGCCSMGCDVPIVGDFHYIGHKLLADHPACAEALDKYRINPGNVGFKEKKDRQFSAIVETAIKHDKPVRIGANWGSLDQELLTHLMDENAQLATAPKEAREVTREAMVQSALLSAERAEEIGLAAIEDHPVGQGLGGAGSDRGLCRSCAALRLRAASRPDRSRHGLARASSPRRRDGHPAAAGHRRHHPRLAHARARRRPHAGGQGRAGAAADHGLPHLRAAGRGLPRLRPHHLDDVPGAGAATSRRSSTTSMPEWKKRYPGVEGLNVAVMGCIVNGPGESKHADIGISLPGTGETPTAPVFIDGKKAATLRGPDGGGGFPEAGDRLYRAAVRRTVARAGRRRSKASACRALCCARAVLHDPA